MSPESRRQGEKMIDAFAFKCSPELKAKIASIAIMENMDASEFVRLAIEAEIEKRRVMYEALHVVFGPGKDNSV